MKIVQINTTYGVSDSTGRTSQEMHRWISEHKISSIVYCVTVNDGSHDKGVYYFSGQRQQKIHGLLSRVTGLQGYFSFLPTVKLIKCLYLEKPSVVILRVLHSNCLNFPLLFRFLSKNKIATVMMTHDCWYMTGHCMSPAFFQCEKWQTVCKKCPAIHMYNPSWFFDTSKKCFLDKKKWFSSLSNLAVVGVSDWATELVKMSMLQNAKIIRRIYNWIDIDIFKPVENKALRHSYQYSDTKPLLLGVASKWSEAKGLQVIIKVAKEMPDVQIILIGFCKKDNTMPENIKLIGEVSDIRKLADYYAMADIFLNPSLYETFGKTTAEAISCGTPVVAYRTTACLELVGDKHGVAVEIGNEEKFILAIKEILKKGKQGFSLDCRRFAEKEFSKEANIKKYLELIDELVEQNDNK